MSMIFKSSTGTMIKVPISTEGIILYYHLFILFNII